jgi:hypothetical protein
VLRVELVTGARKAQLQLGSQSHVFLNEGHRFGRNKNSLSVKSEQSYKM